jgi:hypothetical protein
LICHARASVLFCCDKHLLHLWICLLRPLVLTPFRVLFSPILQRDPNGEGQMQRHLLLARRWCFLLIIIIIFHRCVYERNISLMHVKCIHDLCTLPLDIPPYFHHILVIFMLFDDYWELFTCSLILSD